MKYSLLALFLLGCGLSASANTIGFAERFALAEDRGAVLEDLVPGTEDYYFYHALHQQQTGQDQAFDETLKRWEERHRSSSRRDLLKRRQALLRAVEQPDPFFDLLRRHDSLSFGHSRRGQQNKPTWSSAFNQKVLDPDRLLKEALRRDRDLRQVSDQGLDRLDPGTLTDEQRRLFLQRQPGPFREDLVALIDNDLRAKNSGGFGSLPVHSQLTLAQLDALAAKQPKLLENGNWVMQRLRRMAPPEGTDWVRHPEHEAAHLDTVYAWVKTLPPAFNSLKAQTLYRRIELDLRLDTPDRGRLMEYLQLPRPVGYLPREWSRQRDFREHRVDFNQEYRPCLPYPPIGRDEDVVRQLVGHFLLTDPGFKDAAAPYLERGWINRAEAEEMILAGKGDSEKWAAVLPPSQFQQIRERVEIRFAPGTPLYLPADAEVTLPLELKNLERLLVKVFEINTFNYYREVGSEVAGSIDLDGLVAAETLELELDVPPLRRVQHALSLPACKGPGVYVVELIGNGFSSRAILRKGHLRAVSRPTLLGTLVRVFDEVGTPVSDASLWIEDREFTPDEKGRIVVPFSENGGQRQAVLRRGDFASLETVQLAQETYALAADFDVARERLLSGSMAEVVIRPLLMLGDKPLPLKRLRDTRLQIVAVDHEGTRTETEIRDLTPEDGVDLVVPFRVPEQLRQLSFQLLTEVPRLDGQEPDTLQASYQMPVNGEAASDRTRQLLVRRDGARWMAEVRGRNGERVPGFPVRASVRPVWVTFDENQQLQTDARGQIDLGALEGVERLSLHAEGAHALSLPLGDHTVTWPPMVQIAAGEAVHLSHAEGQRYHLLSLTAGTHRALLEDGVEVGDSLLKLTGLQPGLYRLLAWPAMRELPIRVVGGTQDGPYLVDGGRVAERQDGVASRVLEPKVAGDDVVLQFADLAPGSRVSIVATATMDEGWTPFSGLDPRGPHGLWPGGASGSMYQTGRQLGDEVRYVLERRLLTPYPGNMLRRPEMILFPWVQQETTAEDQVAKEGKAFSQAFGGRAAMASEAKSRTRANFYRMGGKGGQGASSTPDLNWLATPAPRWDNLVPDKDGVIRIPRKALGDRNILHVTLAHPLGAVRQRLVLSAAELQRSDRRLTAVLDPAERHAEVDGVSILRPGAKTTWSLEGATFEPVGDVAGLFQIYKTLVGDERFEDFGFVGRWHTLEQEKKRELFEEHGSHELNLFLYFKDRPFFDEVVKPYLANKLQQDFMDRWLLGKDLSDELVPDRFRRLHPAEQVLLVWRTGDAGQGASTTLQQAGVLWKPDRAVMRQRFNGVLRRSGLAPVTATMAPAAAPMEMSADQSVNGFAALRNVVDSRSRKLEKEMAPAMEMKRAMKPQAAKALSERAVLMDVEEAEMVDELMVFGDEFGGGGERLYRALETTKEWAESFYYRQPFGNDREGLSELNGFWLDLIRHGKESPVLSERVLDPVSTFTEAMFALALLDLPFEEATLDFERGDDDTITLKVDRPVLLFERRVRPVQGIDEPALLVAQRFLDPAERTRLVDGEEQPVFVSEFVKGRVYGGQVVVSNPNPQPLELDVLIQIPEGALPVANGFRTRSTPIRLDGYTTRRMEYFFYFPESGSYAGCPVQLALEDQVVARAEAQTFTVLDDPRPEMANAWARVARDGSNAEVLKALATENLARIDLGEMYFRLREADFFQGAADLLADRQIDDAVVYSYAVHHKDLERVKRYLPLSRFARSVGPVVDSDLLTVDPFLERAWQHLEYHPLVNPRAHQLGAKREIPNARLHSVYMHYMGLLGWRDQLTMDEELMVTYHLLLQDRLDEGLARFDRLDRGALHSQLQYDYLTAYVSFYRDGGKVASKLAKRYRDYPVPVWRKRFGEVANQLAQIHGGADEVLDPEDREQQLDASAAAEAFVKARVEGDTIQLDVGGAKEVTLRFYPMDVELLFSQQPFLEQDAARFRFIRAAETTTVAVPKGAGLVEVALPVAYRSGNVHIEVEAGDALDPVTHLASTLQVRVLEQAGHVDVRLRKGKRQPVAAAYVKVYARLNDGSVRFWKDGYTDLRGRFDYVSRNDLDPSSVDRFALLVVHPDHGAVLEEGGVPVQ